MTRAFVSLPITIVLASGTGFLMHHAADERSADACRRSSGGESSGSD